MQSYSNSLLTSSTFRESRKYLIFRVPLPVQSSMNMTIRRLLSYVNGSPTLLRPSDISRLQDSTALRAVP